MSNTECCASMKMKSWSVALAIWAMSADLAMRTLRPSAIPPVRMRSLTGLTKVLLGIVDMISIPCGSIVDVQAAWDGAMRIFLLVAALLCGFGLFATPACAEVTTVRLSKQYGLPYLPMIV